MRQLPAKARIQAQAAAQYPQYSLNGNGKRPAGPVQLEQPSIGPNGSLKSLPSTSRNADAAHQQGSSINPRTGRPRQPPAEDPNAPLARDKALGDYIEFDLSRLHNSKGGFLVDDDDPAQGGAPRKTIQEVRLERERERQRLREAMEPGVVLDDRVEVCKECGSKELNDQIRKVFGVKVCRACERKLPEKYSLLTKTEVKEVSFRSHVLLSAVPSDMKLAPLCHFQGLSIDRPRAS